MIPGQTALDDLMEAPARQDPWMAARAWISDNQEAWGWMVSTARRLAAEGRHFGMKGLVERVRWEMKVERGDRSYICNNSHTSILARILLSKYPELKPFIETRTGAYVERVSQ